MKEYHKIQTIFKRSELTKKIIPGDYSLPEFEYLHNNQWIGTEKIDGTNIRIIWTGTEVIFKGKTDDAQMPANLVTNLQRKFTAATMQAVFDATPVCLYGEGYGAKIQKAGTRYLPGNDFILFDINVGRWWLNREDVEENAQKLDTKVVPIVFRGTLAEAISQVSAGFTSVVANDSSLIAEGLILTPAIQLFNRKGDRIITKIKNVDFKNL